MSTLEKLAELLSEHDAVLTMTVAAHCLCLGCMVYQVEVENRKIQEDSLAACIDAAYNLISQRHQVQEDDMASTTTHTA